jgi:hypothetical protein
MIAMPATRLVAATMTGRAQAKPATSADETDTGQENAHLKTGLLVAVPTAVRRATQKETAELQPSNSETALEDALAVGRKATPHATVRTQAENATIGLKGATTAARKATFQMNVFQSVSGLESATNAGKKAILRMPALQSGLQGEHQSGSSLGNATIVGRKAILPTNAQSGSGLVSATNAVKKATFHGIVPTIGVPRRGARGTLVTTTNPPSLVALKLL